MILHVDPAELTATARPLREAVEVARQVQGIRSEVVAHPTGTGSEPVRAAVESFLDAWTAGLQGVRERAEMLAAVLDTAATGYAEAEDRMRRQAAAAGPDGGPT